jgi:flagellar basal-body rod modification protein FlgD
MTSSVNNNPPVGSPASGSGSGSSSGSGTPATSAQSATMTQSQFLQLMVAQLQAQDPTNPVDNSQFVSQMAQFSTLSATQDLSSTVTALSSQISDSMSTSQVLSSANLVGRQVLVPSTTATDDGTNPVNGAVNVVTPGDVTVKITDPATGDVIRTLDLGNQPAGLAKFTWDGKDGSGNAVASGNYTLAATTGTDSLTTYVSGAVTGVGYGGTDVGTYLEVAGVGGVALTQVAQIL